ncbi:MAG TPA: hypothetical protein VHO25_09405, partial [Polyangiaceae bacterium]|nr:hypothetical protein [Polyangiaceae bacterium]
MPSWAAAPTATTSAASSITPTSVALNGSGTPNGEAATGWFRISSTNPVTCDDVFGTRVPSFSGTGLGSGVAAMSFSITTTGLTSGITYYYCTVVSNASGKAFGTMQSFTVPGAPVVTTTTATAITSTAATLGGSATPTGASTTGSFRYSTVDPGACNASFGTVTIGTSLGSGFAPATYTRGVTGLAPATTYYYCAIGTNIHGTSFGAVQSFTTLPVAPVVTTGTVTVLGSTSAQLNATANPGGGTTTVWFRYTTTGITNCNDSIGTRVPSSGGTDIGSGFSNVAVTET